jgi:D-glycero-D-manno-heptose 1,7-bisphosphate phosphatase
MKAVILAGGRGERIRPISDTLPKALVPIDGKPIIAHQIEQLERVGVREIFILTGYLAQSIASYCGQLQTNMKIHCIESSLGATPAQRILKSQIDIGDEFLLIYCDNFILSDSNIESVLQSNAAITFLVQSRDVGNIKLNSNQQAFYTSDQRSSNYRAVELGNISVKTKRFMEVLNKTKDLPQTLEKLSNELVCLAVISNSPVNSISNLKTYTSNLRRRRILLLDRDGILVEKMPHREYLSNLYDYKPIYENWSILKEVSNLGVDFLIATNQPGVATGEVSEKFLREFHVRLVSELLDFGINVLAIYICKHHWSENCNCRKPRPGMLLEAMEQFEISTESTLYIGDEPKDSIAASAAGIDYVIINNEVHDEFAFETLKKALPVIKSKVYKID